MIRLSVPDEATRERLADLDVDLVLWDWTGEPPAGDRIDLALRPYTLSGGLDLLDASRVRAVQTQSLGYDDAVGHVPDGITWCNAVGVHEGSTAEIAMALLLAASRALDDAVREGAEGRWSPGFTRGLIGTRVLLVGVGGIGSELLPRLDGFGAHVTRVGSRSRDDELGHVHGTDELPELLPQADAVVVAVPLNDSTERLVDDAFLTALPEGAVVVNVSRGRTADTDAVVRHTASGRVRYASDVWDPEPLPPEHPAWTTPGILVSPHNGGRVTSMHDRVETIVREQVRRLQDGEPLRDVVDVTSTAG